MKIGDVIISLRKQSGVKQKELAEILEITPTYLSLIEKNRTKASMTLLSEIAAYFGITVNAILFKAINLNEVSDKKKAEYIKAATPVVDALIEYLLSGGMVKQKSHSQKVSKVKSAKKDSVTKSRIDLKTVPLVKKKVIDKSLRTSSKRSKV